MNTSELTLQNCLELSSYELEATEGGLIIAPAVFIGKLVDLLWDGPFSV